MISYTCSSEDMINNIENSLRSAFSDVDKGILEMRFMSMSRGTEISANFVTDSDIDSKEVRTRIIDKISLSAISELREIMKDEEQGVWLSGLISFNCLTEEFKISFNYNERFNVLTENWEYSESDDEIFPDRVTLINDFEKYSRNDKNIPDWYFDLLHEQRQIKNAIKKAVPEDVFSEQLDANPQIEEKFDYLSDSEEWKIAWGQLGTVYMRTLLKDKSLLALFVDDSKIPERASYIFDEFEPNVLDEFLTYFMNRTSTKLRAHMINLVQDSNGSESYDLDSEDDFDSDLLEEEFEDVIISMIMSQTRQRFPDLDEVIF